MQRQRACAPPRPPPHTHTFACTPPPPPPHPCRLTRSSCLATCAWRQSRSRAARHLQQSPAQRAPPSRTQGRPGWRRACCRAPPKTLRVWVGGCGGAGGEGGCGVAVGAQVGGAAPLPLPSLPPSLKHTHTHTHSHSRSRSRSPSEPTVSRWRWSTDLKCVDIASSQRCRRSMQSGVLGGWWRGVVGEVDGRVVVVGRRVAGWVGGGVPGARLGQWCGGGHWRRVPLPRARHEQHTACTPTPTPRTAHPPTTPQHSISARCSHLVGGAARLVDEVKGHSGGVVLVLPPGVGVAPVQHLCQ